MPSIQKGRYSILFSSWSYELSKSVQLALERLEKEKRGTPIVDILFLYLTKRVCFVRESNAKFGKGWCVVAAVDSSDALKYISNNRR